MTEIHQDADACAHRIHVPLLTNPDVIFLVGGKQVTMDVGNGYEINNQLVHRVHNGGDEDRIHFIFDYVPPELVAQLPGQEGNRRSPLKTLMVRPVRTSLYHDNLSKRGANR